MKFDLPVKYSEISSKKKKLIREQYVEEQDGLCFYCKQPLKHDPPAWINEKRIDWDLFPPFFLKHPVHLQHDHDTDLTEGAVHAYCNAVMWQYEGR